MGTLPRAEGGGKDRLGVARDRTIAAGGAGGGEVTFWDSTTGGQQPPPIASTDNVYPAGCYNAGRSIAVASGLPGRPPPPAACSCGTSPAEG